MKLLALRGSLPVLRGSHLAALRRRRLLRVVLGSLLASQLFGCGDDAPTRPADAAANDAPGLSSTCEGACKSTALTVTFGSNTRTLDVAYYGITKTASGATLFIESYRGAAAGCPEQTSPTPDYTLILGEVPIPTSAMPSSSSGSILDFKGDLHGDLAPRRITNATLAPVAANVCESCVGTPPPSDPDGMVAFDATIAFEGGTLTGHFYATHCDSLDSVE